MELLDQRVCKEMGLGYGKNGLIDQRVWKKWTYRPEGMEKMDL